jgi:hypothetical protein
MPDRLRATQSLNRAFLHYPKPLSCVSVSLAKAF